jgi:excisionase family DNA binding protein
VTDELLLCIPEMARRLGISRAKAYALVAEGVIPRVQLGTVRRVPVAKLQALIEAGGSAAA